MAVSAPHGNRTGSAASAAARCNAPLYSRMWRLFSLLSACTRRYLIPFWFFCSVLIFSWKRQFSFSPEVHSLFLIGSVLNVKREQELVFLKIMACQNKHYGLISYDIAIYTQCMTTVLNCLQLWRDFGSWGG